MAVDGMHKKRLGRRGENAAARYLKRHGYKILERNYRTPFCEVDIIAKKGEIVAFVEVKTRESDLFGMPREAVNAPKQKLYIRAAQCYLSLLSDDEILRFDVIEVYKGGINHIENAFCGGGEY